MTNPTTPLYYADYLQLDVLLDSQHPASARHGQPAHEESLFIITHQTYELWFKQILHELHSILRLFESTPLQESELNIIIDRLRRIVHIQRVINQQLLIMETMTPLDFLDFRDFLTPASGFQSVQFREIEIRLGLSHHKKAVSFGRFNEIDRDFLCKIANEKSLFERLDQWLSRMPFLKFEDFDFWTQYSNAVEKMLNRDQKTIKENPHMNDTEKSAELVILQNTRQSFECLFDARLYRQLQQKGDFRLNHSATLAALFIQLYRGEPLLQAPFNLLKQLMDIDEQLTAWRSGHAIMVQRIVGTKIGTGGSSGHNYLKSTINRNRIFNDLFNLSTYLIPRSQLPKLPDHLKKYLGFYQPRK